MTGDAVNTRKEERLSTNFIADSKYVHWLGTCIRRVYNGF